MFAKFKKTGIVLLLTCALTAMLTACNFGVQDDPLPEGYDAGAIKAEARKLIEYINEDDWEAFCSVPMTDEMKETMTVGSMEKILNQYIGDRGAFVKNKSMVVIGAKDSDGNDYAAAVAVVKYENQSVTYTITYDRDLNLVGFYLK